MTRYVGLTHDEIAHRWANDPEGNDYGRGFNMFFENGTVYSYGDHFPIARHVTNDQGEKAVLFTARDYSISTAKHMTITARACHHLKVFMVPVVGIDHVRNMRYFQSLYDAEIARLERINCNSYKHADLFRYAGEIVQNSKEYAAFFGLNDCVVQIFKEHCEWIKARFERLTSPEAKSKRSEKARKKNANLIARWHGGENVRLPLNITPTENEARWRRNALLVRYAREIAEYAEGERNHIGRELFDCMTPEQTAQRQAFELERDKEKVEAWRHGDNVSFGYNTSTPCMLRLKGDLIETSWRASFPVKDAKMAFRLVQRVRKSGKCWLPNGEKSPVLGLYKINRIAGDGTVKAGCHTVAWSEIENIAKQLELI